MAKSKKIIQQRTSENTHKIDSLIEISPNERATPQQAEMGSVPNLLKLLSESAIFNPHEIEALNGVVVVLFL